ARLIAQTIDILQQRSPDENFFQGLPMEDIEQRLQDSLRYHREVTVHRYHPRDDLGGALGFLNFDRERIRHLIERGFADAVTHDCRMGKVDGCVLRSPESLAAGGEMGYEARPEGEA